MYSKFAFDFVFFNYYNFSCYLKEKVTKDCLSNRETAHFAMHTESAHNFFKSMVDIQPKVLEDVDAIFKEFPCNYWIAGPFAQFVSG